MELLNKVAPLKTKFLRANHSKFVTKDESKAIMLRTKLRNQLLKKRTLEARTKYNKQRNICVSLVKKAKRNYYKNLDQKDVNDNKGIIRNEIKVANVFNKYFVNMVPSMGITNNHIFLSNKHF